MIVEIVMILPLFLAMIFMIMELGHIAFKTILVNHVAYEVARIGSLTAGDNPLTRRPGNYVRQMESALKDMLPDAKLKSRRERTLSDPQAGKWNQDLIVTIDYPSPLVFPMSSFILANQPPPGLERIPGSRWIRANVRMPIEQPLYK
ncbi:MAG: pilus assembly protein [Elusimicrobia bacterium]|nr:pilus assembly protein [Elusimicrobiota bacterium]